MKRRTFTTVLLVCCFAVCLAAVIADLNGKFIGVLNAPDGNQYPLTYTFKVDGDKLTGTLDAANISVPIDSGKVSGDDFKFSVSIEGQAYAQKGKYFAAGDSISLDVDFAGANAHTTLQRAK